MSPDDTIRSNQSSIEELKARSASYRPEESDVDLSSSRLININETNCLKQSHGASVSERAAQQRYGDLVAASTVLLVDQDRMTIEFMEQVLETVGFKSDRCLSGQKAIKLV